MFLHADTFCVHGTSKLIQVSSDNLKIDIKPKETYKNAGDYPIDGQKSVFLYCFLDLGEPS